MDAHDRVGQGEALDAARAEALARTNLGTAFMMHLCTRASALEPVPFLASAPTR
ncbi:MAG: hypothetical protein KKA73_24380 [Chloroflexi bacterium]|nr:hypothetical protein [Chloroflexota bacterium]MBU1750831.1 hypothetical protein [Chloroflexota bacterium]MBU1878044.1 hypothetical protein [Chloroflexota bacterium]